MVARPALNQVATFQETTNVVRIAGDGRARHPGLWGMGHFGALRGYIIFGQHIGLLPGRHRFR